MSHVRAYGLTIASDIALEELPASDDAPDVTIRLGTGAPPDALKIDVDTIARFAVSGGNAIHVDPAPGASTDSIKLFLMGSAFGALLHQRGLLVLHGNAIRIGDACMICVGDSGVGKSTVAAGLAARGYPSLADDVVAVTADRRALPGLPRVRLWQDAAERLGHDPADLRRVRPGFDKFVLPAEPATEALPIRWIHVLDTEDRSDVASTPITGAAQFQALNENTYRPAYIARTLGVTAHFRLCVDLAGHVAMFRTVRPAQGETDRKSVV